MAARPATASDSFSYTVKDQLGDTAGGTVNVAVDLNPIITGTVAGQTTTIGATDKPFSGTVFA